MWVNHEGRAATMVASWPWVLRVLLLLLLVWLSHSLWGKDRERGRNPDPALFPLGHTDTHSFHQWLYTWGLLPIRGVLELWGAWGYWYDGSPFCTTWTGLNPLLNVLLDIHIGDRPAYYLNFTSLYIYTQSIFTRFHIHWIFKYKNHVTQGKNCSSFGKILSH